MTTTTATEYQFTASIQSKGKQRNSEGWSLTLDWKLPGSKYDLVLYGRDWDDVANWDVGDRAIFMISQGGLKTGKDGRYTSDYFWNLQDIVGGDNVPASRPTNRPAATAPQEAPPVDSGPPVRQDDVQVRIEKGMAFNAAYTLLAKAKAPSTMDLRKLWSEIYHDVIERGVPPLHYCFDHDEPRKQTEKGGWFHPMVDGDHLGYCVENEGFVPGNKPEQIEEPEPTTAEDDLDDLYNNTDR